MAKYVGFKIGKVHESHVISEYYCGGCGWPVTDHDSFCPECGGAFRECDASNLEAENARLKQELETVGIAAYLYGQTNLAAENAKLRGLVADAISLIWLGNVDCSGCLHMRECYAGEATDFAPENCRLVIRARELGIEVNDD